MTDRLFDNQTFTNIDYSAKDLSGRVYDSCIFTNCNFSQCNLTDTDFIECIFENCDFSLVKFSSTGLRDIKFKASKLIGADLSGCKEMFLSFSFEKCTLDYSSFQNKKITNTIFRECSMKETDFSESDLSGSSFIKCDLSGAVFFETVLEKADLASSFNYSINPEKNRISCARFSLDGVTGLLGKYNIIIED
jgi:fluoroquinolone resistance protein